MLVGCRPLVRKLHFHVVGNRQRRWITLAVTLALLATGVASSGMQRERALAAHAAGIACALVVSGAVAFVSYLRRAPKALIEPDGQDGR